MVAKLVCVDVITVSRALNNTAYVHLNTKDRMYADAKELSDHPNVMVGRASAYHITGTKTAPAAPQGDFRRRGAWNLSIYGTQYAGRGTG